MKNLLDLGSTAVVVVTLVLFVVALIAKGFVHDMLLETGVFLVSVKLVMMNHQNRRATQALEAKLDALAAALVRTDPPRAES